MERDIDRVLEATGKQPSQIRALDACGGSGNISLKLLRRGVNVTLADISSELQGIFEKKCAEHGYEPTVVCSEIGRFIASGSEPFDLIVFSSALHHLEHIGDSALAACSGPSLIRLRMRTRVWQPGSW